MELFDSYIKNIENLLDGMTSKRFPFDKANVWPTSARGELILVRDSAYELGGGDKNSVGLSVVAENLNVENETLLFGPDISEIKVDCDFAKIVLLKIKDFSADEQQLFNVVKELEYVKYKVNVKGFMARASAMNHREQIRVGKEAVKNGLSFEKIGNTLIESYLKYPNVAAAKIIFVTDSRLNFDELTAQAEKVSALTKALNHILDNVLVDCKNCNLKPICDEVEGMRELHVGMAKK